MREYLFLGTVKNPYFTWPFGTNPQAHGIGSGSSKHWPVCHPRLSWLAIT
ncbi:MAG: hypothetical protein VYC70_06600 [Verrucomicrobiota bacterium]|nr:hypothetical protein [Verrucomicrobiota bacterium]